MKKQLQLWKVGELAQRTGVSVRALHHYNQIGLLIPSERSKAGYRLYAEQDLIRLQLIKSLQQLHFSLQEIKASLDKNNFSLLQVIPLHISKLEEQITLQQQLCDRLKRVAEILNSREKVSPEQFIQLIYLTTMTEQNFTPEEMAKIKAQGEKYGEKVIHEVELEWPQLIAQVKAEMAKGTDPSDPVVLGYAKRWKELVSMFTGGDPGIEKKLKKMYTEGEGMQNKFEGAPDPAMVAYVQKAFEALEKKS